MQSKLGRNEPCWCASGKKFKKCHLDREAKEKPTVAESLIALKGANRARDCACPPDMKSDCVGKPIQSHTIAKSLGLNDIAEDGHVFVLQHDFSTLSRTGGKAAFGDKGVNRASVFPGFCTYHDSKLFAPIETRPFSGAPDQCALLSYRALARERFTKMAGIDVNEFIKGADKGRPMEWQLALQHFAAKYGEGLSAALRDLEVAMRSHYEAVVNGDFAAFESAVFEFEQEFPLLCTTGYFPSRLDRKNSSRPRQSETGSGLADRSLFHL